MELIDYVRMVGRQWLWVVIFALVGVTGAVVWSATRPASYRAEAELFIGNPYQGAGETSQSSEAQIAAQFTLSRMATYAGLIDSTGVTNGVIADVGGDLSVGRLMNQVAVINPEKTVLLNIVATDSDSKTALALASSSARRLSAAIEALDNPTTKGAKPLVKATVTIPGSEPVAKGANSTFVVGLGLLIGVAFGLVVASLRDQIRKPRRRLAAEAAATAPSAASGPPAEDPAALLGSDDPAPGYDERVAHANGGGTHTNGVPASRSKRPREAGAREW